MNIRGDSGIFFAFTLILAISSTSQAYLAERYEFESLQPQKSFWQAPPEKQFERILLMNGGGYDIYSFFGILDEMEAQNQKPDLVIGLCGSSISAAVMHLLPDAQSRRHFVFSEKFQKLLLAAEKRKLLSKTGLKMTGKIFGIWGRALGLNDKLPALYDLPVVSFNESFRIPELDVPFGMGAGIPTVIVSSKVDIYEEDKGKKFEGRKMFQQTFFTDEKIAPALRGFLAPVAKYFPNSSVKETTRTRTDVNVYDAMRGSVSDMYFMAPYKLNDERYLTGGFDLYPLELARGIGEKVYTTYVNAVDPIMSVPSVKSAYRFNINERTRIGTSGFADHWMDLSDKTNWGKLKIKILKGPSKDYEQYKKVAMGQYLIGRCRAQESLAFDQANTKVHIRNPNDRNTFKGLQAAIKSDRASANLQPTNCEPEQILKLLDENPQLYQDPTQFEAFLNSNFSRQSI